MFIIMESVIQIFGVAWCILCVGCAMATMASYIIESIKNK